MRILSIIIGLFLCTSVWGQITQRPERPRQPKLREVQINMTSLITQILPFQSSTGLDGPFQFQFKSGRNNNLFSMKLGARVNGIDEAGNYLNLAIGYNRRRNLSDKFNLNIGYHFVIIAGTFNDPINSLNETAGVGFGWDIGFQYNISSRFSIGTSTMLFIGPTSNSFTITMVPPVGIFLAGRLN